MKLETIDPICGMPVQPDSSRRADFGETTYLFCSDGCRKEFLQDPALHAQSPGGHRMPDAADPAGGWKAYIPLLVVIVVTAAAALARQVGELPAFSSHAAMNDFMGLFLVSFAMFKLFDLHGFADGFQLYDLLARPVRQYALLYPFLELGLGLAYHARWQPRAVAWATILLMSFGVLGIVRSVLRKEKIQCACMGTILRVPLSTVAVVENIGMAGMAVAMLAWR